jgi:hypothetical protein
MRPIALALFVIAVLAGQAAPSWAAEVTRSELVQASATAGGTLPSGEGFGATIDAFDFVQDGTPGRNTAVDLFLDHGECTTTAPDATLRAAPNLSRATLRGSVEGECFDFTTQTGSPFRAVLDLRFTATGPGDAGTGHDGDCVTVERHRPATVTGTIRFEIGNAVATAEPDPAGQLRSARSICRSAG